MSREVEKPTLNEHGAETHPAFGMISAARVSYGPPGQTLFQSDIAHGRTIRLMIDTATRRRDLKNDYVHSNMSGEVVEVEMSEAQWASFVSSMNTSGVPCTIRRRESKQVPEFPHEPRLALTMRETHEAAHEAFGTILEALRELEALEQGDSTPKQRREALRKLKVRIQNATPNVDFAGRQLAKQAEAVVERARADIEAMVTQKAAQLGLAPTDAQGLVALDIAPQRAIEQKEQP